MMEARSTAPIVIYGAARSGTTYLVQIFNKHPQVHVSDETRIFAWVHDVFRRLTGDDRTCYRKRDEFVDYLRRTLGEYVRDFYRELAPEALWWGDKNPHYVHPHNQGCLETILELFPGVRFVHIMRDGRDVVTSGLRGVWKDFESVHRMWTSHVELGCSFGRALPSDQYLEFRYEDLVEDDLAMARRIFEFLQIDFHPAVEQFCRNQMESRTPFCTPSRDIRVDVQTSDWADYLDPRQQLQSLELLGEHLVRFGYETRESLDRARRSLREAPAADASGASRQREGYVPRKAYGAVVQRIRNIAQATLPEGSRVLVISRGDYRLVDLGGAEGWHFPQTEDGTYGGSHPLDSDVAISHLEALRKKGANYLLIPQTALWWLEYYQEFRQHLESRYWPLMQDRDTCFIYSLRARRA